MTQQKTTDTLPSPDLVLGRLARAQRRFPIWLDPYLDLIKHKPLATFGGAVMLVMMLVALFAGVLAPYDPVEPNMTARLRAPDSSHLLGTDQLGRDELSRIIYGAQISLLVGLGAVFIGTSGATIIGGVSGYFGGWVDTVVQRVVDAVLAMPALILLLAIVSVLGPSLLNIVIALSFRAAIGESRTIRSAVISIKENQYVDGARAIGANNLHILVHYILPNVTAPIMVLASVSLGGAILAEASLSFLGFGVPPPAPSWGGMLSLEGRRFMIVAPWLAIAPGLSLSLVVFGINVLGDGLRDVLDPRLRGARG